MKNIPKLSFLLIGMLLFATCQKETNLLPTPLVDETYELEAIIQNHPVNPDDVALEILQKTQWSQTEAILQERAYVPPGKVLSYEKTYVTEDIAHYTFTIATGQGEHDKVGLHRVVKEAAPGTPIRSYDAFFVQHGNGFDFTTTMLPGQISPYTADDFGMAVYLAENDVDVWGIDQAWMLTPLETEDLSFMQEWGLQRQVRDLRLAIAVARILRFRTGTNINKMLLLGYSSGVPTGFATLNEEAVMEPFMRSINGFVAFDFPIKIDNEALREFEVQNVENYQALLDAGQYAEYLPYTLIASQARAYPKDPSPLIPGVTNEQSTLLSGAAPIKGVIPFHYLAGNFVDNFPVSFQFATPDQWLDMLIMNAPYQPTLFSREYLALPTDYEEMPFDDHFSEITVPILNVCPAGGFGQISHYGMGFMGSEDITNLDIQLYPPEAAMIDFGHIDLVLAKNAEELVWAPVLDWIRKH